MRPGEQFAVIVADNVTLTVLRLDRVLCIGALPFEWSLWSNGATIARGRAAEFSGALVAAAAQLREFHL